MPPSPVMRSWPSAAYINPAAMNIAALAVACDIACSIPPLSAPPLSIRAVRVSKASAKHQEEIADLRQRRVGDQELQPLLS